jgi:hypothetical protein
MHRNAKRKMTLWLTTAAIVGAGTFAAAAGAGAFSPARVGYRYYWTQSGPPAYHARLNLTDRGY